MGHLSVREGSLVQKEAGTLVNLLSTVAAPARTKAQLKAFWSFWSDWIRNGRRSPFRVVLAGSRPGIYTTWLECSRNVCGFAGAEFQLGQGLTHVRRPSALGMSATVPSC